MLHDEKPPLDEALLIHFGIKGMKWGVRKKQPREFSTESRVLEKGYALQNVSAGKAVAVGERRIFTSHTAKDNLVYRSTYANTLKFMSGDAETYTNTLVMTKRLKVASDKKAYDEFKKLYDKDPAGMIRSIAESYEALNRTIMGFGDVPDTKVIDSKVKSYSKKGEDWVQNQGYDLFTTGTGTGMFNPKIADTYYTNLARQGYHAIRDNTDVRAKMADDPIVILKPNRSVKLTQTVPLTNADIKLARQHYKQMKRDEKAGSPS